jgi:low temperature requirement protein LtrA
MKHLKASFRIWWQKPKKISEIEEGREISFLELFYDLAYVGIIYQITHALVDNFTMVGLWQYVALYAMVWFAWVNGTLYHELHGNNDIRTRFFTFLQVFALAFIAIFAPTAFGTGAAGFALSYAAFLAIVTFLWWRTGVHDVEHKPLSTPYTTGFLLTTTMFVGSLFVPTGLMFYMWGGGIGLALLLPVVLPLFRRDVNPEQLEEAMRIRPSLVERFGLLTIIVLGEVVASVMRGASYHSEITLDVIVLTALGLLIASTMWWSYFDLAARRVPVQKTGKRLLWIYVHLPITMSIGLVASGLLYLLKHPDTVTDFSRWMIVGAVAVFLFSLTILIQTLQVRPENVVVYKKASRVALLAAIIIIGIGFSSLSIVATLSLIAFLLVAPVYAAIRFWIARRYNDQNRTEV